MLVVHRDNNQGGSSYLGQARDLVSSQDAHVTWGSQIMGIKTKGEDYVNSPIQCISQDRSWFLGAMFKGQDSHVCLEAVSSGAEVAVDLWWPKRFSRDLEVCPTFIAEPLGRCYNR